LLAASARFFCGCGNLRLSAGLHQGLAERGQQSGERNWSGILGPRDAVHFHPELAGTGKRGVNEQDFEVFVAFKILDGNSQACFHGSMILGGFTKNNRARGRAWSTA
jgi:hypothetical protein